MIKLQNFASEQRMERWESIETLAAKLNMPILLEMSTKGITAEDISEMKWNEAGMYGISQEDYMKIKTYFKNKNEKKAKRESNQVSPMGYNPQPTSPQSVKASPIVVAHIEHTEKKWSKSLFSCFDNPISCCFGCCCPCVLYGVVKAQRSEEGYGTVCSQCTLYFCSIVCFGLCAFVGGSQRSDVRKKYGIHGDGCEDCCVHFCCTACALTQEYEEVQYHKSKTSPTGDGYEPTSQMGYK
jgi:Cys-rich protein (TIGR01571 family)